MSGDSPAGGARNYEIPGQAGTRAKREPRPEGVNDGRRVPVKSGMTTGEPQKARE